MLQNTERREASEGLPTYCADFHDKISVNKMIYNSFGETGLMVSAIGFGGSQLPLFYQTPQEEECIQSVVEAVKHGINYIDTAPYYGFGTAEIILGKALKKIPRETYYIATKVGRYLGDIPSMFDFSAERTFKSVEESLQKLGLEYVDVIQVHDLEFAPNLDIVMNETLPALQKIKESGKAKFIGITGYPLEILKKIIERSTVKIDIVLSYSRCTLVEQALMDYIPYFKEKRIGIVNAAVLGMGLLTNRGPPDWHPASSEIKAACHSAAQYCKQEKDVDIAKLAVYYSLSQTGIDTHLIGIADITVLKKNLDVLQNGLTLTENDVIQEIMTRYFERLPIKNWENVELDNYWRKMQENTS